MCYRFQQRWEQAVSPEEMREIVESLMGSAFGIEEIPSDFSQQANIALTDTALVVTNQVPRKAEMLRFGLIPYNARDMQSVLGRYGNARAETVATLSVYRLPFQKKRCLIPVSGFYEWREDPISKKKVPYCAFVPGEKLFSLAGLWDRWIDPKTNEEFRSFTIITTNPNDLMAQLHNRMPVILPKEHYEEWLSPDGTDQERLKSLLKAFPAEEMAYQEYGRAVNNSKIKDSAQIVPVGEVVTL